jgi:hypothetical protein
MLILEQLMPMKRQHCRLFSDNTPVVRWTTNLVAEADSVVAAHLLRALAMQSRTIEAALPLTADWPGDRNDHADTASRSTSKFHSGPDRGGSCVKDCTFLTLFPSTLYLPQEASWRLQQVPEHQLSLLLIWTLCGQRLPMQQWMVKLASATGKSGPPTASTTATATHSFATSKKQSDFKCSWASLPAALWAFGVEGAKFKPIQLRLDWAHRSDLRVGWISRPTQTRTRWPRHAPSLYKALPFIPGTRPSAGATDCTTRQTFPRHCRTIRQL